MVGQSYIHFAWLSENDVIQRPVVQLVTLKDDEDDDDTCDFDKKGR